MPKASKLAAPAAKAAKVSKTSKASSATPTKKTGPAKLYSNFHPLPVALPTPVPIASSSTASLKAGATTTHYLFVRPHTAKATAPEEERERADRTLFAANLPVDIGTHSLRAMFGKWGVVEEVIVSTNSTGGDVLENAVRGLPVEDDSDDEDEEVEDEEEAPEAERAEPTFAGIKTATLPRSQRKRRRPNTLPPSVPELIDLPALDPRATPYGASGGRSARIVFIDTVSLPRAMAYTGSTLSLPADKKSSAAEPEGLTYYEAQYAALRPTLAAVREHADSAMARYDHLHSLLLSSRAKAHGAGALVDEDGFTVVVRGGRYGRTAGRGGDPGGGGVGVAARGWAKEAATKKGGKGSGELKDFYRFQGTDRKRKELADMRARFEEDKQKVAELKKTRRYKPY